MKATFATGLSLLLLLGLCGCDRPQPSGHSHGGHSHGGHGHDDHGHGEEDAGETASFTLFTETHELFVELDVPVAGQTVSHHAHVTRLADNAPAVGGSFGVAFLEAAESNRVAQSCAVDGVARTGIFTPTGPAPNQPGRYRLVYRYQDGAEIAEWDAGEIEVGREPVLPEAQREGEITFLKETSWSLPFRIRKPQRRVLARSLTLPAHVEPDPRFSSSLAAPATGRVLWSSGEQATLPGRHVAAGEILGRLVPESSYESWNALELELLHARIDQERAAAELERLEGLLADGLVSERRVLDARAERDRATAALRSARSELETRAGDAPALELKAPAAGIVTERLLRHGERAEAGQALARIAAADRVLVHGTLRGARPDELHRLSFAHARTLTGGQEVDLVEAGATLLSTPLVVDPQSGGLEVSWSVPNDGRLLIGELVELTVGLGEPVERLTVPIGAVVEVNTRPQAFVQLTGESFEQRRLELGVSDGERIEVLSGLSEEDLVVTQGGFEVYVASIAGTVESHRH